jgi:hypothetical protein
MRKLIFIALGLCLLAGGCQSYRNMNTAPGSAPKFWVYHGPDVGYRPIWSVRVR